MNAMNLDREAREYVAHFHAMGAEHLGRGEYGRAVAEVNGRFAEALFREGRVSLPYSMGELYIVSMPTKVRLRRSGTIYCSRRVDLEATRAVVEDNPELADSPAKWVYKDGEVRHRIVWLCPRIANSMLFRFVPATALRRRLERMEDECPDKIQCFDYARLMESLGYDKRTYLKYNNPCKPKPGAWGERRKRWKGLPV